MNSFKTNDRVNIRYLDTIDRDPGAFKKDTLILVRQSFVLSLPPMTALYFVFGGSDTLYNFASLYTALPSTPIITLLLPCQKCRLICLYLARSFSYLPSPNLCWPLFISAIFHHAWNFSAPCLTRKQLLTKPRYTALQAPPQSGSATFQLSPNHIASSHPICEAMAGATSPHTAITLADWPWTCEN